MRDGTGGVDLHTHTSYSDGLDTPAVVVAKAAQQALRSIAITDHDTVAALPEAQHAGITYGLEVIAGIELSVQYQQFEDIHLLGYFFDPSYEPLQARLALLQQGRKQRGIDMLTCINRRLAHLGKAPLDSQQVLQQAHGAVTRPHLAQALIAHGYTSNMQSAFRDFLIPCNKPKAVLGPEEALALIAQAGGVCSLAHPGTLSTDPQVLYPLLETLKALGLIGLEVYHRCHYPQTIDFFHACAERYALIPTGGSDYHGRAEGATLGQLAPEYPVPTHTLQNLRLAQARCVRESS